MTINNITNASKIMLGSQEIEKLYIGGTILYLKSSSTPSESFFCKLELTDGTIVNLEGSGELTKAMVATPYASTLYKMHVGNLCTSIGYQAVIQCKKLVELIVDEGVTTIANQTFNGDGKLTVIDLPSTLTSIGAYSFHNMGTGVNVIIRATTPPSIGNNNLFDSANTIIYVPDSSLSAYQTAWSGWATRIKALSTIYYDAELEYIETSGTQWIDTGITSTSTMVSQIKFNLLSTSSSSHVYGYRKANDYESYRLFFNGSTGLMYDGPGTSSSNKRRITMNNSVSKDTVFEFELGNNYVKNLVTGNNIGSSNSKYLDGISTITLSYWEGNGSNSDVSSARWYYVKIYEDSTLILDLIPVRKDGVGYMFDRVSKTLFTNQGTGDFILGPDKS